MFQTEIERTQLNVNLVFEHGYGRDNGEPTQLKYQWQVRHHWKRWLHFGAQGFGEVGTWNHWSPRAQQSHRAGPALFGSLPGGPGTLSWQLAWLEGKTYARRGGMLTGACPLRLLASLARPSSRLMTYPAASPFRGTPTARRSPTLAAMNDPWPLLIAALSGQRTTIPPTWPVRTVHRLDACVSAARAAQQPRESMDRRSPPSITR